MNEDWGRNGEEIDRDNYDDDADDSNEGDDMDYSGEGGEEEEEREIHFADEMYRSGGSEDESDDGGDDDDVDDDEVDDEIVEQFMCKFSNGDYDAEIDNALICPDRSDSAPARPTQA
jgi:hypothetical protein